MPITDTDSIAKAVAATLAAQDIAPGFTTAFVLTAHFDGSGATTGAKATFATRVGDHWTTGAFFDVQYHKPVEAGIYVKMVW